MQKKILIIIGLAILLGGGYMMLRNTETPEWAMAKGTVLPQLMRTKNKDLMPLVHASFSDSLDIGYVFDDETRYDFIMQPQLEQLGINQQTLHKQAMKNFTALTETPAFDVSNAGTSENEKYLIIETGDGFAASRLVSKAVQKRIIDELGEGATVAIPMRDILIAWPANFPLEEAFIEQVNTEFEAEETYELTTDLFIVDKSGVTPRL
ncbi:MAG: DUF1444 family protein [bacterium]|nr:DUF1444 family protein [bacterium]